MGKYTPPKIYKGKINNPIPKGSSKLKELAKNKWYVNFSYEGNQIRITGGINRIKDAIEKEYAAQVLLRRIEFDLSNGFNPNEPNKWIENKIKETCSLREAIIEFKDYHRKHNSRPKTIATYLSKLYALSEFYPGIHISELTTQNLETFIQDKINNNIYSNSSVKAAKRIFSTFFNICIKLQLINANPYLGFDKKINSKKQTKAKHIPFSDEDLRMLLEFLDNNDKYAAFFCRMIYYTCLRPSEIRGLKIQNIDLVNGTITVPASITKVTNDNQNEIIAINESFRPFLENLKLYEYPLNYYLTGSTINIVGKVQVGVNSPYNKLISALQKLGMDNKGYTLYSFKHTSNIKKYLSGWTIAEIMKANRHSSISTTEIYLRDLGHFVSIKEKIIPVI